MNPALVAMLSCVVVIALLAGVAAKFHVGFDPTAFVIGFSGALIGMR